MAILPDFAALWDAYPRGTPDDAKASIGGALNLAWVTNTCAIRVSHALLESGFNITDGPGITTARGGNGKRYIFRVADLETYLNGTVGPPTTKVASPSARLVAGQRGIIQFAVSGWSDATGHFDLWNGSECAGSEYFSESHEVSIWAC
jgi:Type VI secretion system (T6SS), amidase effector protein 4